MSKSSRTNLTASAKKTPVPVPRPRLDLNAVLGCEYGHYPWDDWERWALAQGLSRDLAGQGRLLIREAYNHGWQPWLHSLCGWSDDGAALLSHALRAPRVARWCWSRLLETDGLRGDIHPETGEWTWGYLRIDTRRVLSALHAASTFSYRNN
jgi:hypothetical protein